MITNIARALDRSAFNESNDPNKQQELQRRRKKAMTAARAYVADWEAKDDDDERMEELVRRYPHYYKDIRHLRFLDIYQVCALWEVPDHSGAIQHAIKKLIVSGGRTAGKTRDTDISEAMFTIQRYIEMTRLIPDFLQHDYGFDLINFITEQTVFSEQTFGPGTREVGVCNHIRKELEEIRESLEADKVHEWVDVILLSLDGAWRSGASPLEIAQALRAKLDRNKRRTWPDWRQHSEDQPIEHVKTDE